MISSSAKLIRPMPVSLPRDMEALRNAGALFGVSYHFYSWSRASLLELRLSLSRSASKRMTPSTSSQLVKARKSVVLSEKGKALVQLDRHGYLTSSILGVGWKRTSALVALDTGI